MQGFSGVLDPENGEEIWTYTTLRGQECLSDHPKPATDYHLKTGQRE
jgi:hypothetical protein